MSSPLGMLTFQRRLREFRASQSRRFPPILGRWKRRWNAGCLRRSTPRTNSPVRASSVSHPTVLARSRSLLWWVTQRENSRVEPLPLDADLTELGTYQAGLEDIEWYRVPAATGRPHMTGPFVDYMCTDQFAFTFTVPLKISGEFYGVAGIDMTVRSLRKRSNRSSKTSAQVATCSPTLTWSLSASIHNSPQAAGSNPSSSRPTTSRSCPEPCCRSRPLAEDVLPGGADSPEGPVPIVDA